LLEQLELDRRLRLALDGLGFTQSTAVQDQVIPAALAGKDLVVSAETGSGKTFAYLLPMVQRFHAGAVAFAVLKQAPRSGDNNLGIFAKQ